MCFFQEGGREGLTLQLDVVTAAVPPPRTAAAVYRGMGRLRSWM